MNALQKQETAYARLVRKTNLIELGKSLMLKRKVIRPNVLAIHRENILMPLLKEKGIDPHGYVLAAKEEKKVVTYYMDLQKKALEEFIDSLQE